MMKRVKEKRTITNKEVLSDNPYVDSEYCNSVFRKYIYAKGLEGGMQGDGVTMLGVGGADGNQYFMLQAYDDKYVMQEGSKEGGRFVPHYEWQGITTYEFNKDFEDLTSLFGFPENFGLDDVIFEEDVVENKKRGNMKRVKEMARVVRAEQFDMDFCADSFAEVMNGNLHEYGVEAGTCPGNANLENPATRKFYLKYPTKDGKEDTIFFTCKIRDGGYKLEDSPMNGARHLFDAFECPPNVAAQNSPKAVRGFYFNDVIDLADDIMNYFADNGVPYHEDEEDLEESIKRSRKASKKIQEMARVSRRDEPKADDYLKSFTEIATDDFGFECETRKCFGNKFDIPIFRNGEEKATDRIIVKVSELGYEMEDEKAISDRFKGQGLDDFENDVNDILNDIMYDLVKDDPEYKKAMGIEESKKGSKKKSLKERHVGENAKQFEDPNEAFDTWFSFCDAWMVESMINDSLGDFDYENDPEEMIYPQVAEKNGIRICFNAMFNEDEDGIEYYIRVEDKDGELLDEYTSEYASADELEGDLRRIEHDYIEE